MKQTMAGVAFCNNSSLPPRSIRARAGYRRGVQTPNRTTRQILAVGASTGGTVAIETILQNLPVDGPATVITQHMPSLFTSAFAERLNASTAMEVREARDGDTVAPGLALIAPGDQHMLLRRCGTRYYVNLKQGPLVNRHRPSVDVMFRSVALTAGQDAIGVILTGMGKDGAKGLLEMRKAGATTLAQNENSCVIFGMPKVAIEMDAVDEIMELDKIPQRIIRLNKSAELYTLARSA